MPKCKGCGGDAPSGRRYCADCDGGENALGAYNAAVLGMEKAGRTLAMAVDSPAHRPRVTAAAFVQQLRDYNLLGNAESASGMLARKVLHSLSPSESQAGACDTLSAAHCRILLYALVSVPASGLWSIALCQELRGAESIFDIEGVRSCLTAKLALGFAPHECEGDVVLPESLFPGEGFSMCGACQRRLLPKDALTVCDEVGCATCESCIAKSLTHLRCPKDHRLNSTLVRAVGSRFPKEAAADCVQRLDERNRVQLHRYVCTRHINPEVLDYDWRRARSVVVCMKCDAADYCADCKARAHPQVQCHQAAFARSVYAHIVSNNQHGVVSEIARWNVEEADRAAHSSVCSCCHRFHQSDSPMCPCGSTAPRASAAPWLRGQLTAADCTLLNPSSA
jgi:hypothetical protein